MPDIQPGEVCTCQRPKCGHKWITRVANPQQCPRCKSYKWRGEK